MITDRIPKLGIERRVENLEKRMDNVYSSDSNTMSNAELTAAVNRIGKDIEKLKRRVHQEAINQHEATAAKGLSELESVYIEFIIFGQKVIANVWCDPYKEKFKLHREYNWYPGISNEYHNPYDFAMEELCRECGIRRSGVDKESYHMEKKL